MPGGQLPVSRIKTIMKSSPEVNIISKEATFVMTRAAENFIKLLTKESEENSKKTSGGKKLDYKNVANVVNSSDRYEFLSEIIPHKITVAQFRNLMKQKNKEDGSSSEDTDESED